MLHHRHVALGSLLAATCLSFALPSASAVACELSEPQKGTVAESKDGGRTWTHTGGSLVGVSQQKGLSLPDGGIALTYRSHSWQQPGVAISYDEGRTFCYEMEGPYETTNAFVTGPTEFSVFTAVSHRSDASAAVYRLIAEQDGCGD